MIPWSRFVWDVLSDSWPINFGCFCRRGRRFLLPCLFILRGETVKSVTRGDFEDFRPYNSRFFLEICLSRHPREIFARSAKASHFIFTLAASLQDFCSPAFSTYVKIRTVCSLRENNLPLFRCRLQITWHGCSRKGWLSPKLPTDSHSNWIELDFDSILTVESIIDVVEL